MSNKNYPAFMRFNSPTLELREIVKEYPELSGRLQKYIIAMEYFEGIECQLEQVSGEKNFAAAISLMRRNDVGMDGKSSLEGEDVYQFVNLQLPYGMTALGLRKLSKHMTMLCERDRNLASGLPHKNYQSARKAEGKKGGRAKAALLAPLHDEIEQLYWDETSKNPNETAKFYAFSIQEDVLSFIETDPVRYQSVGSGSGAPKERDYFEFIYRAIRKLKNNKAKK